RGARGPARDPGRARARAADWARPRREFPGAAWVSAAAGGEAPVALGPPAFQPIERVHAAAAALGLPWWTIAPFGVTGDDEPGADPAQAIEPNEPGEPGPFRINASLAPSYRGDASRMLADVRDWLAEGWRVVLVTEGHGPAQR